MHCVLFTSLKIGATKTGANADAPLSRCCATQQLHPNQLLIFACTTTCLHNAKPKRKGDKPLKQAVK
jgi:hypothetical protein